MTILIYYPFNLRSDSIVCQVKILQELGHRVVFLSSSEWGVLHSELKSMGVEVFARSPNRAYSGARFFLDEARKLRSIGKSSGADCILAHLQGNAMVAGLAYRFSSMPVLYMRHNSDYYQLRNSRKELWINSLANNWSTKVLAISRKVEEQLLLEGVEKRKIQRVNLAYDFANQREVAMEEVTALRDKYRGGIRLLIAARLDRLKRHILAFEVVRNLRKLDLDVILICVGEGEERQNLRSWIEDNSMEEVIFMPGHINDLDSYYAASDILINLSESEASSHVVKEGAMRGCTALVCAGVGDFEDYMQDGVSAIIVPKVNPVPEATRQLADLISNRGSLHRMAAKLREAVFNSFDLHAVKGQYQSVFKSYAE